MAFSIRLTEEERNLAESYAKLHSFSLAEAFKRALFEKIEDEYEKYTRDDRRNSRPGLSRRLFLSFVHFKEGGPLPEASA